MKKSDTIIITVLVNAALLAVIFLFAVEEGEPNPMKLTSSQETPKVAEAEIVVIPPLPPAPPAPTITKAADEGDLLLKEFQTGKIALSTQTPNPPPTATAVSKDSDPVYYTIKPGDNPWKIARNNKVKLSDLLKLNNLSEERAKNLKPGDKIRIK